MTAYFELNNLSFGYTGKPLLFEGINFTLNANEKVALVGDNGIGKTTFLHLLVGLLRPVSGSIKAFGQHCEAEKDFVEVRKQAGLLFQDADDMLFSPTVIEDVAFGPLNLGLSTLKATQKARDVLTSLGLQGFESRITHELSGGQKRLVSLACVLAMEPKVLLLDEPTTGLDAKAKAKLLEVLGQLDQSLILITHDQDVRELLTTQEFSLT